MKKIISALLLATLLANQVGTAQIYQVGIEPHYPPMEFLDEEATIVGYDVDLIHAIAENQGFEVQLNADTWDNIFNLLENGERDIIISTVTKTPERTKLYDFSDEYFEINFSVLYDKEKLGEIKTIDDMRPYKIGVLITSSDLERLKQKGFENVYGYSTVFLGLKALTQGKIDILYSEDVVGGYALSHYPELNFAFNLINSDENSSSPIAIAVKKGNTELLDKLNAGLKNLKENGQLEELRQKWINTSN